MPLPLANCFTLAKMWDGQRPGAEGLVQRTTVNEMTRLLMEVSILLCHYCKPPLIPAPVSVLRRAEPPGCASSLGRVYDYFNVSQERANISSDSRHVPLSECTTDGLRCCPNWFDNTGRARPRPPIMGSLDPCQHQKARGVGPIPCALVLLHPEVLANL